MPIPAPSGAPGAPRAPRAPAATRRAALAATGVGLVLAGCGQGRPGQPREGGDAAAEVDETTLTTARAELTAMLAHVAAVRRRHRSLRRRLAPLQEAHEAQRGVLDPGAAVLASDVPPAVEVPDDPADALARVRRDEERLQRRLVTWAVAVDSGPLARLLAAISAGLAQQLRLLDPEGEQA